jgi:hypothetical protein
MEAEVHSVIKNLKNTTSTVGHDRLKVSTLKAYRDSLITPITSIVNKSLENGDFPDVLKISHVMYDNMVSVITQTQILWPSRNSK